MPTYRISYPTAATKGGGGDTIVPVESYDLGPKIKAAIACGAFVALGLTVIVSGLTLPKLLLKAWLTYTAIAIVIGFVITCALGVWWSFEAAYRAWRVDSKTRKRLWKFEDEERKAQVEAAKRAAAKVRNEDDDDGIPWTLNDKQRLDLLAVTIFDRAYNKELSVTREDMGAEGLCTQEDWNLVTKVLKSIGLKKGYKMQPIDFSTAWATWQENFKMEEGYIWAMKPGGDWKALERID